MTTSPTSKTIRSRVDEIEKAHASFLTKEDVRDEVLATPRHQDKKESPAGAGNAGELATKKWVTEQTKKSIWESLKSPEVVGVPLALVLAKIELPALFNLEALLDRHLDKVGVGRNAAGLYWRLRRKESVSRQRQEIFRRRVMNREIPAVNKRITDVRTRINKRITEVERRSAQIDRSHSADIASLKESVRRLQSDRDQIRERVRGTPSGRITQSGNANTFSSTAQHVNRLEMRIDSLVAALD